MFCHFNWLFLSLSLTSRFSLCLPSDCWVESVRVCKQQKCVHWRDRFPSADNEAPFPHEEAVSILSLTVATCAWRAINSLGSPCLFESCPSAPPCKAVLNFSLLSSAWPRLHKCHFNAPKNLTSKGPLLFETSIHSQMFDVHIFKKLHCKGPYLWLGECTFFVFPFKTKFGWDKMKKFYFFK